ncbi:MAG: PilZ domain-containing protein [Myxococcota bacterium]|nr:PilZ domain-containing protein [Myxococcota bacterium]
MGRLARQRRVRCRLACEVLDCGRRPVRGVLCSLSAGGLSLEARLRVEQGDGIRLRILPHRRARAVTVGAIVWNDRPLRGAGRKGALRTIGCVVSDPPQAYLDLIAEVDECNGHAGPLPPSVRPAPDVDLLRSGEPPPAPKPLADEAPLSRPGAASSGPKPLADEVPLSRPGAASSGPKPLADEVPLSRPGAASSGPKPLADEAPLSRPGAASSGPKPLADEAPLSRPGAASSGPKPLADEALSSFRVRVKRVGGRRMRTFRTRMRTASAATDRVHAALGGTQGAWEVLDTVEETDRDIVKEIDGA